MRRASRSGLYAVKNSRRGRTRLVVESLESRAMPTVTGTVFVDLNMNGAQDPEDNGVAGVMVTATDDKGATESVKTDDSGSYELTTGADNLRIEFSNLPQGTAPGRVAGTSGPMVRFLNGDSDRTSVDLALSAPMLVTTQFYYDRALDGNNIDQPAVLAVDYGNENPTPITLANFSDVGSVWGVASQSSSNSIYVSSFVKRHAGLGPNASGEGTTTGGIYRIDRSTDPATVSLLIDLNASGSGYATGGDPHPSQAEFDDGDWYHDAATVPLVGKRGLGGMAMSQDGRTLYVVNLNTKELIEIPLNPDGSRDTSRSLRHTPVPLGNPAGSGISNFQASDLRPFAVAVKGNTVFVGETYTAETGIQSAKDLRAIVYAYDPSQGAFRSFNQSAATFAKSGTPAPVLIASLNYSRGIADDPDPSVTGDEVSADWMRWTSKFDTSKGGEGFPVHPQPWLTSIAFDGNAMILGLRDRFGDQSGFETGNTDSGSDDSFSAIAVGDILRASPSNTGGWQLESGGSSGGVATVGAQDGRGPGGGEFYSGDNAGDFPQKVVMGAVAQFPGLQTVAATGIDPVNSFGGGIYTFFNSNTNSTGLSNAGTAATKTELYVSDSQDTFGSANGLGGLAVIAADGTVQVGDRLFIDMNKNGQQNAGEPGLSGVVVKLFQNGTQVDSATTAADGIYLFNKLQPNTVYQIRIDMTQPAIRGRSLTSSNGVTLDGTTAVVPFKTGNEGTTDTSFDVGFLPNSSDGSGSSSGSNSGGGSNTGGQSGGSTGSGGDQQPPDGSGDSSGSTTPPDQGGASGSGSTTPGDGGTGSSGGTTTGGDNSGTSGGTTTGDQGSGSSTGSSGGTSTGGDNSGTSGGQGSDTSGTGTSNSGGDNTGSSGGSNSDGQGSENSGSGTTPPTGSNSGNAGGTTNSGGGSSGGDATGGTGGSTTGSGNSGGSNSGGTTPGEQNPGSQDNQNPSPQGTASLEGRVFLDFNNSGTFNGPDVGVQNATLTLSGGPLSAPVTVHTDASGNFNFTNLPAGTYTLTESPPASPATLPGKIHAGSAHGHVATSNSISKIVIKNGKAAKNYRFALAPIVSTGGTVFEDSNNNGTLDSNEHGIAGVSIKLTGRSVFTGKIAAQTVTTDASGNYSFTNLTPGRYKITETPPVGYLDGLKQNGVPTAVLGKHKFSGINLTKSASASGGFNFGELKPASISGSVFDDVNSDENPAGMGVTGIAGAKVHLVGKDDRGHAVDMTTKSGTDGTFSFVDLRPGTYRLIESQPHGYLDGSNVAGNMGGNATKVHNQVRGIVIGEGSTATGYLFAEHSTPNLVVSQSPQSVSMSPGGKITITYKVWNKGTATAPGVTATMNFGGLKFVSSNSAEFDNSTRVWSVGDLAAGASKTIKITYRVGHAGEYTPSVSAKMSSVLSEGKPKKASSTLFAGVPMPLSGSSFLSSVIAAWQRWWWV